MSKQQDNIRYKACVDSIVVLRLLPDSLTNEDRTDVLDHRFAKFRTNMAMVEDIRRINSEDQWNQFKPLDELEQLDEASSLHRKSFKYIRGEKVSESSYNPDSEIVCTQGIHYFKTVEAALSWYERHHKTRCNAKANGAYRFYSHDGSIFCLTEVENGAIVKIENYNDIGQLSSICHYKYLCLNGEFIELYDNGQVMISGTYAHNAKVGTWYTYSRDGQLMSKEHY